MTTDRVDELAERFAVALINKLARSEPMVVDGKQGNQIEIVDVSAAAFGLAEAFLAEKSRRASSREAGDDEALTDAMSTGHGHGQRDGIIDAARFLDEQGFALAANQVRSNWPNFFEQPALATPPVSGNRREVGAVTATTVDIDIAYQRITVSSNPLKIVWLDGTCAVMNERISRSDEVEATVFIRWATPAECARHGIHYVNRTAPVAGSGHAYEPISGLGIGKCRVCGCGQNAVDHLVKTTPTPVAGSEKFKVGDRVRDLTPNDRGVGEVTIAKGESGAMVKFQSGEFARWPNEIELAPATSSPVERPRYVRIEMYAEPKVRPVLSWSDDGNPNVPVCDNNGNLDANQPCHVPTRGSWVPADAPASEGEFDEMKEREKATETYGKNPTVTADTHGMVAYIEGWLASAKVRR